MSIFALLDILSIFAFWTFCQIFALPQTLFSFSGHSDSLFSPSARIVMGQLIREGTGSFDLLTSPNYALFRSNNKGEENVWPISETGNNLVMLEIGRAHV